MSDPLRIQIGSHVRMHYSLRLQDGTPVESTVEDDEPIEFRLGDGTLTPGLEIALLGLQQGARQSLEIEPGIAFDLPDAANVHVLFRSDFGGSEVSASDDSQLVLESGQVVEFQSPNGQTIMGTIASVNTDTVEVDFNHPLAGRVVIFDVEILHVGQPEPSSSEKV